MLHPNFGQSGFIRSYKGFTLAEALITLGIAAIVAVLGIYTITNQPNQSNQYGRTTDDLINHLEMACESVKMAYGTGPLYAKKVSAVSGPGNHNFDFAYTETPTTEDADGWQSAAYTSRCTLHPEIADTYTCHALYRGMSIFLPEWESSVKTGTAPVRLEYPSNVIVYTRPDEATVTDTLNQIPNEGSDNTPVGFAHDDIMDYTDDREWLLLDMNGTKSPNSITAGGDRVLVNVNDKNCRILTARQKCKEVNPGSNCTEAYAQSFYDVYKNYCPDWSTNCPQ